MDQVSVFEDIAHRTGGNIYIGVVGPVRTGTSENPLLSSGLRRRSFFRVWKMRICGSVPETSCRRADPDEPS